MLNMVGTSQRKARPFSFKKHYLLFWEFVVSSKMDGGELLLVMLCLGMFASCNCAPDNGGATTAVYIVTLKHVPTSHYYSELRVKQHQRRKHNGSDGMSRFDRPRYSFFLILYNHLTLLLSSLFWNLLLLSRPCIFFPYLFPFLVLYEFHFPGLFDT